MSRRRFALIAGGGTAGHAFVALAVARALAERGTDPDAIELVGSRRGLEASLATGEGFPVTLLAGRGIRRRLAARALLDNAVALAGLAWATVRAAALVIGRRPKVVVSVGGYAAVPVGLAAVPTRTPLVLVNVDAVPGAAHRLLDRFAAASAVAFAGTELRRAVVTGAPVRKDLVGVRAGDRGPVSRAALGLPPDRRTVGVFGGSLGAGRLNAATLEVAERLRARGSLTLYHVTGARNFEAMVAARSASGAPGEDDRSGLWYTMVPFEEHMGDFYGATDVVVCRAGALTVAELALVGAPSVLVPLPGAPGDHQSANARALVAAGAAVVLDDAECDGRRLADLLNELLADPARLAAMGTAAAALGRPDAADAVAALVVEHAR